ncbi:hypothetical protein GCM10027599_13710 [Yimella radicis]
MLRAADVQVNVATMVAAAQERHGRSERPRLIDQGGIAFPTHVGVVAARGKEFVTSAQGSQLQVHEG